MERKTTKESQGSRKERKQMQKPDKEKAVAEEIQEADGFPFPDLND